MTVYLSEPIPVDQSAIKQEIVESLQARLPNLTVEPGTLLDYLIDSFASIVAQDRQLLTEVLAIIFRYYGEKILRIPQRDATQASTLATFTASDTLGHTIPAGMQITLAGLDATRVAFEVVADVVIPPLSSATALGEVELLAVTAGAEGTGLISDPQPEETLAWLLSITVLAPTAGGADAEDDDAYLDRLADTTPLSGFTLVLLEDFERGARTLLTDDGRALAIDQYKPGPPYDGAAAATGVEKTITVALANGTGADYGATLRGEVQVILDAARETGFAVWVIAATYTAITVVFAAKAVAGFDPADVEARAEAAVLDFIDPAHHGLPTSGDQRLWIDTPLVRFQDISTVLNTVEGLDHWTSLTINGGIVDVALTGPAALPSPAPASSAAGTVTL